jgi:NAD(P)-dependent dehydrogenase (short-subunit alcohol dehydrogenase family)
MEISGKRVLITGASRGLGRTLAFAFGAAGTRQVLAGARQAEDFESLTAAATTAGLSITPIKLDVTSDDDVQAALNSGASIF